MEHSIERPEWFQTVLTVLALVVAAAAIRLLHIEESMGLPRLMPLVVVGFAVHAALPLRFRISFFLFLGLAGSFVLFGPIQALMLIGSGLALIGACHLPIPRWARIGVVVLLTAGLATVRAGVVYVPGATAVLPILASMFMFRLLIYLYDLPNERQAVPISARLAYFFMLPNLCFPLFPVVDYKRFTASHYVRDANAIYRKGIALMLLGTSHILIYRGLQLFLAPDPTSIDDVQDVVLYALTAFLQYFRISGMFHIAVGMVCLFGFDLPPVNRWFLFATSGADLWRRINIYWKDFLQRLVFFPIFMRLRKQSESRRYGVAIFAVFVSSWALHAWQWFWLRGELLVSGVDVGFWSLVGIGVVTSSLEEAWKGKTQAPRSPLGEAFVRARSAFFVFGTTCLLWSLWISSSVAEWIHIMGQARHGSLDMVARIFGVAGVVFGVCVGLFWLQIRDRLPSTAPLFSGPALVGGAAVFALLGFSAPQLPEDSALLALTFEPHDGPVGYYEGLMERGNANWDLYLDDTLVQPTKDARLVKLKPSIRSTLRDQAFRTNSHGMRDGPVTKARMPGVVRIALLGASPELGWGVADGEEYPALLDEALGSSVEVLNFAMAGYGAVQQVPVLEEALAFEPDLVLLMSHCQADAVLLQRLLMRLAKRGPPFPPGLEGRVPWSLSDPTERRVKIEGELESLTRQSYMSIAEMSRANGAIPLWVFLRLPNTPKCSPPSPDEVEAMADSAGLETLILSGVYRGEDQSRLVVTGDIHPNPRAHRLIAANLAKRLAPWIRKLEEPDKP